MTEPRMSFQLNERRQGAKTDTWEVWSLSGGIHLGRVVWHTPWRKYCFFPAGKTLFDEGCLGILATFVEWETKKHRTGKRSFEELPA